MSTPVYLSNASADASSVSFSLPYGTDLLVIFASRVSGTTASPPTGATYNSVACTLAASGDSSAGSFETSVALFYMLYQSLPAPGSSYTAAFTGGSGTNLGIVVAAFANINQAAPTGTDGNAGSLDTAINGLIGNLMVACAVVDGATPPALSSGGTLIANTTRMGTSYHILTANESPHTVDYVGANDARYTSAAAMFAQWAGGGPIWM